MLAGIAVGLIGYSAYQSSSSLLNAFTLILLFSLFVFATRSWGAVWNSISLLQQPPIIALIGIAAGYYYFAMDGFGFLPSSSGALGLALIGFALGTIIYAYWNIA